MARRRQAREAVLQLLFQNDFNTDITPHVAKDMLYELVEDEVLREFGWSLYVGTLAQRDALDGQIQEIAANWRVSRMAPTDRNILRMGIFEMTSIGTPPAVVIDECIELAREYGTEQSGQFVNGILDKLIPAAEPPAK